MNELTDDGIAAVAMKWAKDEGPWFEFERNDFIACVRELLIKADREHRPAALEAVAKGLPETYRRIGYIHAGDKHIYDRRGKPSDQPVYVREAPITGDNRAKI